jgi:hypothetical protein
MGLVKICVKISAPQVHFNPRWANGQVGNLTKPGPSHTLFNSCPYRDTSERWSLALYPICRRYIWDFEICRDRPRFLRSMLLTIFHQVSKMSLNSLFFISIHFKALNCCNPSMVYSSLYKSVYVINSLLT